MKTKLIITGMATMAIVVGTSVALFADEEQEDSAKQAELTAQAKVTEADALQTAQGLVPTGAMKDHEIEKEKGKLIWSFDFSTPNSTDTTEVNINAITGKPVSMEWESAADEQQEEASENKSKDDDDDKNSEKKDKDDEKN